MIISLSLYGVKLGLLLYKVGVIKLNQTATKDSRLHAPTEQRYAYQIRGSLFNFLVVSDLKI